MPVYNAGTTNIGLRSDVQLNSASAFSIESTSNVSANEILTNHYNPASASKNLNFISNISYRVIAFQASRCTITISSPSTYPAWKWKSGDSGNGTSSTSITHTDYITNGRSLYMKGTSYSTYSFITINIAADYGYGVSSYAWYNSAGAFISGVTTTATAYTLYSGSDTGGSLYFMRWFAT